MTKKIAKLSLLFAALLAAAALTAPSAGAEGFEIKAFDAQASAGPPPDANNEPFDGIQPPDEAEPADPANFPSAYTQAAGRPYDFTTQIRFARRTDGSEFPAAPLRDAFVEGPSGLIGNPTTVAQCSSDQLALNIGLPDCPPAAQVGFVHLTIPICFGPDFCFPFLLFTPLYSMVPPPGVPARFSFNAAGAIVSLDAELRSGGDYGITVASRQAAQSLPVTGAAVIFWGDPADPVHTPMRSCSGKPSPAEGGPSCEAGVPPRTFLRMPTSCEGPETIPVRADSWPQPGVFDSASVQTHLPGGLPVPGLEIERPVIPTSEWGPPTGQTGCNEVPFEPTLEVETSSHAADSPTGLSVDLSVPQSCWKADQQESLCQSDLEKAVVTLPQGMSVNPSSVGGLEACSSEQIGMTTQVGETPIHFTDAPNNCPNASKIGNAEITTPLLDHPVKGAVYLAKQSDNPFGSLLAIYLDFEDPQSGTIIKLAGHVEAGKEGRLTTSFDENPQLPFERLHVDLFGGSRASLRTPPTCGTFAARATLTPWSGNPAVKRDAAFEVTEGPAGGNCFGNGFNPKLTAGSQNPLAGATSPWSLRLTREDGTQELSSLTLHEPPGQSGYLAGIPYCPDSALAAISGAEGTGAAQIASPSCPAASRLGTVTVGAGAGVTPFFTDKGRAYLAGPYKGAPLSVAVLTPAVAGPFDLGSVLVRNAVYVDPTTAELTIKSDPLPTVLHGIPLDLRDVRVNLNRDHFIVNPTSCEPMQFTSTITSTQGAAANPSDRFQVLNCERLAFKPKLSLSIKGKTNRGAHPRFSATLKMPQGGANIARAQVTLPRSEILDQAHIKTICTRVQYAANGGGGAGCPAGSVYGYARAFTPLLDKPLEGPVYLRSSSHKLPDLVASLGGQIHIDLDGHIDAVKGRIRNTFEVVPDAPVSKFTLTMQGGKKGLLVNSDGVCSGANRADVEFDGQSGKVDDFNLQLRASCKGELRKH